MASILPEPGWPLPDRGVRRSMLGRRRVLPAALSGEDALLVTALVLLTARLVSVLPASFGVDSWLELATGRLVWQGGIPHHETLTALALGRPWIDQQWLAQLTSYALYRLGGLGTLGAINVLLLMSGPALAVKTARRLGASPRDMLVPLFLCSLLLLPIREVRTQAFAIPLFSLTVYLLALDGRCPSRRVYLTLPILVLWANLHGTVTIGAGLVALRGLTLAWERRNSLRHPRAIARPIVLVIGPAVALLMTPYGLDAITYYRSTLGNGALRHVVTEWQPVTASVVVAAPLLVMAGLLIWSFGRFAERTTLWDRIALVALAAASVGVIRNVAFFALCALAIAPLSLSGVFGPSKSRNPAVRRRLNGALVTLSIAIALTTIALALSWPATKLEEANNRPAMLVAVSQAMRADHGLRVIADSRYGDLILWAEPWTAGRVALDGRFELYSPRDLESYQHMFSVVGPDWSRAADGYRLLVLNRVADEASVRAFLAERGARVLYADAQAIVILRGRAE